MDWDGMGWDGEVDEYECGGEEGRGWEGMGSYIPLSHSFPWYHFCCVLRCFKVLRYFPKFCFSWRSIFTRYEDGIENTNPDRGIACEGGCMSTKRIGVWSERETV